MALFHLRERPCVYIVEKDGEVVVVLDSAKTALDYIDKIYGRCINFSGDMASSITFRYDKKSVVTLSCHIVRTEGDF